MSKKYYLGRLLPDAELNPVDYNRVMIAHAGNRIDEIFACEFTPKHATHGQRYAAVTGPFRTKRAAIFMSRTSPNPHCRTVSEAERLVKIHPHLGVVA